MVYWCPNCGAQSEAQMAGCLACAAMDSYLPMVTVRRPGMRRKGVAVSNARELAAGSASMIGLPFVGAVPTTEPVQVAVWGPPGSGKTTLALQFADAVAARGLSVMYGAIEEGFNESLREKLRRLEIRRETLVVCGPCLAGDVLAEHQKRDLDWFVLDSYTAGGWDIPSLGELRRAGISVLMLLHATKDNGAAGSLSLLHGADIVLAVHGGKWRTEKTRFGAPSEGALWQT